MDKREIESKAEQVLRDHGLIGAAPIDPLVVARALRIKVMNAVFSDPDKSGAISRRGGVFSIYVNANDPPARKRFTIAHEIGHCLLHMSQGSDGEFVDTVDNYRVAAPDTAAKWDEARRKEYEANVFAAALLMGAESIRQKWGENKDATHLAWQFQVSPKAMQIRLSELGLMNGGAD